MKKIEKKIKKEVEEVHDRLDRHFDRSMKEIRAIWSTVDRIRDRLEQDNNNEKVQMNAIIEKNNENETAPELLNAVKQLQDFIKYFDKQRIHYQQYCKGLGDFAWALDSKIRRLESEVAPILPQPADPVGKWAEIEGSAFISTAEIGHVKTPQELEQERQEAEQRALEQARIEGVKDPNAPLDYELFRKLPEQTVLRIFQERKNKRPGARGRYLSEEEKAIGRQSLAKLGALWRRYYHENAGTPFEEQEMDNWNLGALDEKDLERPRDDVKSILHEKRKLYRYNHQLTKRPKTVCETCKAFVQPGHKCWPTSWESDGKRPGEKQVTVFEQQGKGATTPLRKRLAFQMQFYQ